MPYKSVLTRLWWPRVPARFRFPTGSASTERMIRSRQSAQHQLVVVAAALLLTPPWIVPFVSYGGYMTVHPGENIAPLMAVVVAYRADC